MTEEEKDILILKILERPQSLTDDEISLILSDQELLDIYKTSIKVKDAIRPSLKIDPAKEWELMKNRIQASHIEGSTSKAPSKEFHPEEDRKSFIANLSRTLFRRPVAAAVGTILLAGVIGVGLLWNPVHLKQNGNPGFNYEGIVHSTPQNNSKNDNSNNSDNSDNNSNLITDIGYQTSEALNEGTLNSQESKTENKAGLKNVEPTLKPQYSSIYTNEVSSVQSETPEIESSQEKQLKKSPMDQINPAKEIITVINDPNNQDLAYSEENLNNFELKPLEGLLPEDWDIDQCLKLQQARIDNELALAMAQNRKREYEIYRENLLMEYQISNPDSDDAKLEEIRDYLDEIFGNLYSAIP